MASEASQHLPDKQHLDPAPGTCGKARCQSQVYESPGFVLQQERKYIKNKFKKAKNGLFKDFLWYFSCLSPIALFSTRLSLAALTSVLSREGSVLAACTANTCTNTSC